MYQMGTPPIFSYGTPQHLSQFTDPNNTTIFVGGLSGYVTEDKIPVSSVVGDSSWYTNHLIRRTTTHLTLRLLGSFKIQNPANSECNVGSPRKQKILSKAAEAPRRRPISKATKTLVDFASVTFKN